MPASASVSWWQFDLPVAASVADDVAALLVNFGALGVELIDTPDKNTTLLRANYDGALKTATLKSHARRGFEEMGLRLPDEAVLTRREDTDWAEAWKKGLTPLKVGDALFIVPTWDTTFVTPPGAHVIRLDPGMAFGTGHHATTALCLAQVEKAVARGAHSVLDVGCGTGVLAMAAVLGGAKQVHGIDNDPIAVTVANENATQNGMADQIAFSETPLAKLSEAYDCVVANILAPTLIEMADDLIRVTQTNGCLILSGVLETQADDVTTALVAAAHRAHRKQWKLTERVVSGEWVALVVAQG